MHTMNGVLLRIRTVLALMDSWLAVGLVLHIDIVTGQMAIVWHHRL